MFERVMSGQIEFGSWFDHVLGWWEASKTRDDILYLFYEDFITDQRGYIQKVADFLEVKLPEEEMQRIMDATCFSSMKQNPQTNYGGDRGNKAPPFMRKGKVGDWVEYFTNEQSERFEQLLEEKITSKSDLRFTFSFDANE